MTISIFGLGYVGCVSLGCLAQNGYDIIGIDVSKTKVDLINRGLPTIIEKDIDLIIADQFAAGKISATNDYLYAVLNSDVSIICVGTPSTERGSLNLEYIYKTAVQIGEGLIQKASYHIVVIRSTVLPGTNAKVGEIIENTASLTRGKDFDVVSNPEFLREGTAVEDYYNPPFTLIGTDSSKAAETMKEIYSKVSGEFVESDIKTAEIIKYVNNSYHALKVAFTNEVGNICKQLGIDSHEVMRLFCMDKQLNISAYYFKPGFAYGGSCLPKDLKALNTLAIDNNLRSHILESIDPSNVNHINMATKMLLSKGNKRIGILGIAFKEGTDDLRYSPIITLIEDLIESGREVRVHDKYVNEALLIGANSEYIASNLPYLSSMLCNTEDEIIAWAELVVFNSKSDNFANLVLLHPEKMFVDLVRLKSIPLATNYEGLCW